MGDDKNDGAVAGLGDLGDIGAMMKDMDPAKLEELMREGMKDPAVQEMVRKMYQNFIYFFRLHLINENAIMNSIMKSLWECKVPWKNF